MGFGLIAIIPTTYQCYYGYSLRRSGRDSLCALTSHVRLSCLTPFGLMQIFSRQICAGIQKPRPVLSAVVRDGKR